MTIHNFIIIIILTGLLNIVSCSKQKDSTSNQLDYRQSVDILYQYYWGGHGGTIENPNLLDQKLLSRRANNPHAAFIYNVLLLNGYISPSLENNDEQVRRNTAAKSLLEMANNGYVPAAYYISEQSPKDGVGQRLFVQSALTQTQYYQKIIDYIRLAEANNFYCGNSIYLLIFGEKHMFADQDYDEIWLSSSKGSPLRLQQTQALNYQDRQLLDKLIIQLEQSRDIESSTYETQELINFYIDGLGQAPDYNKAYFWTEFIIAQYQPIKKTAPDHAHEQISYFQDMQKELTLKSKLTPNQIQEIKTQVSELIKQKQTPITFDWQPQVWIFEQPPYTTR